MKKYNIIYADPPWSYRVWSKDTGLGRSAESHYKTMSKSDIQALPISNIADTNCVLFLWVTAPCLIEGIELCGAWGFKYKTVGFTWIKKNKVSDSLFFGLGHWTRANAEFCLIATKGNPKRIDKSVHSVVISQIGRHSEKPLEVRDRIVRLMGDIPRIELFARKRTEGWTSIGYDIDGMDIKESLDFLGG